MEETGVESGWNGTSPFYSGEITSSNDVQNGRILNKRTSSTGNVWGVYGGSGRNCGLAAYNATESSASKLEEIGSSFAGVDYSSTKYATKYFIDSTNQNPPQDWEPNFYEFFKVGDAVKEVFCGYYYQNRWNYGFEAWLGDRLSTPSGDYPFFARGGSTSDGFRAGRFSLMVNGGQPDYVRTVLIP